MNAAGGIPKPIVFLRHCTTFCFWGFPHAEGTCISSGKQRSRTKKFGTRTQESTKLWSSVATSLGRAVHSGHLSCPYRYPLHSCCTLCTGHSMWHEVASSFAFMCVVFFACLHAKNVQSFIAENEDQNAKSLRFIIHSSCFASDLHVEAWCMAVSCLGPRC